ncbi:MAG TPA: LuxR C-terminal-related transcriptional regulator, partial [Pseudonocardiaceae bacterium]|nr:LuxR C-terminal-related transcriptional regulator [Pseudonocardiaceae bacterium]
RLLEGLPIAIEFAADRLDVLSIEQLAERLTEGIYPLLHTSRRATREAQRTLRALADSSYRLCTDDERALLARLAVFSGRFQLEAVAPVCAGGPVSEDSVLTLITGLVDKSILVRDEHPGDSWYRLPALLRDYAHQYLMHSGEWASLQRRHAQWCVSLAEQAGVGLVSSRTDRWVGQVRGNHDNIRSAFEFCLRNGLPGEAVRLAVGLADYWMIESRTAEGRRWLAQALAEPSLSPGDRSAALTIAAYLAIIDDDDAADGLISAARETGCHRAPSGPGNLLFVTALRASQRGELDDIHGDLTEALTQFRAKGDIMGISRTLWLLGAVSIWNGDPAASLRYTDEFIHTPGVAGDNWGAGFIHFTMALAKVQLGDVLGGLADQRRCAEAVRRMDDRLGMLWCVRSSPIVLLANDRPAEAAMMMGAGDQHHVFTLRAMDQLRDRCARSLRDKLGQSQFDDLAAQGARLSLREAIDIIAERHSDQVSEDLQDETTLSSREWEVASLIAEGRSNKEIAAALVISTRTAEGHVRRILNKLDLLSRSQVAAWMAEHRALHGRPRATTY